MKFIEVKLPIEIADDSEVIDVIREAMHEIGYDYYNNEACGRDCWLYRYAPKMEPISYNATPIDESLIRDILKEELTKGEVRAMIASELDDYTKNEKLKKTIKNLTADVLEDFLDSLWRRKSFWKGTIKRS